jgi:hypothetical protein
MLRIFILTFILFFYGYSQEISLEKSSCYIESNSDIGTWIHVADQGPLEMILPMSLIESNIQEYAYTAFVHIDKFKISNVDSKSREKQITYHAKVLETFKGNKLQEIEFSKTIDIDEQICIDSTIAGHDLLISLEKHQNSLFGPDVGCASGLSDELKNKLTKEK